MIYKGFVVFSAILAVLVDHYSALEYSETHYISDEYGNVKYGYMSQTQTSRVHFQQVEPNRKPIVPIPVYRPVLGFGGFRPLQYGPHLVPRLIPLGHLPPPPPRGRFPVVLQYAATDPDVTSKRVTRAREEESSSNNKLEKIIRDETKYQESGRVPQYPISHKLDQRKLYSHGHLYSDDPLAGFYVG